MKKPPSIQKQYIILRHGKKLHQLRIDRREKGKHYSMSIGLLGMPYPKETYSDNIDIEKKDSHATITLPKIFSTEIDVASVVQFFQPFSTLKHRRIKHVMFDMSSIIAIDICAIVMLLTKITQLTKNGIRCVGNEPLNDDCKKVFRDSGFLQHMCNITGNKFDRNNEYNLIVKRGETETESELTGKTIKKAVCHLTGSERHYTPVQSIVQEMAGNAIEHAYSQNQHWLFCVNYTGNEICFILSDAGKGILSTINRKHKKIIETLQLLDDKQILFRAFEKKYGSVTNEVNRNKGLPLIKRISDEKRIFDLKVITNNVSLHFDDFHKSTLMSNKYSGTIYTWKINKELLENGQQAFN